MEEGGDGRKMEEGGDGRKMKEGGDGRKMEEGGRVEEHMITITVHSQMPGKPRTYQS